MIINYLELFIYLFTILIGIALIIGTKMKLKIFINPSGFYPYIYFIKKIFGLNGLICFNYILGGASIAIGLFLFIKSIVLSCHVQP